MRLKLVEGPSPSVRGERLTLLDRSALIDGRVARIRQCGYLDGRLGVPDFVLQELETAAASPDPQVSNPAKRGLQCAAAMEGTPGFVACSASRKGANASETDQLVEIALELDAAVVTCNHNVRVAVTAAGGRALDIQGLAVALQAVHLPGEPITVTVYKPGKEPGQGIGYLDDGTVVVIERGASRLGETVEATVTSVLQTVAGKMIFASIPHGECGDSSRVGTRLPVAPPVRGAAAAVDSP